MKIVRATDALYALCTRVRFMGTHGVLQKVRSARVEASALQRRRLQRCAPDRRCRMLQRHARCAVEKRWQAGRACPGGVKPSRAAPSRAFDQVERSIADEYKVETELPRQDAAGR